MQRRNAVKGRNGKGDSAQKPAVVGESVYETVEPGKAGSESGYQAVVRLPDGCGGVPYAASAWHRPTGDGGTRSDDEQPASPQIKAG